MFYSIAGKNFLVCRKISPRSLSFSTSLSETHKLLWKTCRDFSEGELIPIAATFDQEHKYPKEQVFIYSAHIFFFFKYIQY